MCLDCEFCPQMHGKQLATTKKNGFIEGIHEHNLSSTKLTSCQFNSIGRAHDRSIIEYILWDDPPNSNVYNLLP